MAKQVTKERDKSFKVLLSKSFAQVHPHYMLIVLLESCYWLLVEQFDVCFDGVFYLAYFDILVGGMTACALAWTQFQRRE